MLSEAQRAGWIETPKCILTARGSRRHGRAFVGDGCEAGTQAKPAAAWLVFRRDVNANQHACQSPRLNWCQQDRQVVEQARKRGGGKGERIPKEENTQHIHKITN